jgi:hypothetical protein
MVQGSVGGGYKERPVEGEDGQARSRQGTAGPPKDEPGASVARREALKKVVRYEAHLSRQLYKALHELEALQTRRLGGSFG